MIAAGSSNIVTARSFLEEFGGAFPEEPELVRFGVGGDCPNPRLLQSAPKAHCLKQANPELFIKFAEPW